MDLYSSGQYVVFVSVVTILVQPLGRYLERVLSRRHTAFDRMAFIRGLARDRAGTVGNFWVDLPRGLLWMLLPGALVGAVVLIWVNLLLGEVVFGGLGTGLFSVVMAALIAVFIAGLMVGRTPEYVGKKIGPAENKMIVLYAIVAPLAVLPLTALAVTITAGLAGLTTHGGPHGLTEILRLARGDGRVELFARAHAGTRARASAAVQVTFVSPSATDIPSCRS